jgi:hypothetical protein
VKIVITYAIPDTAPEWFHQAVQDGDNSGIMEYTDGLRPESIEAQ